MSTAPKVFQFQFGTIKRGKEKYRINSICLFQFQFGTIKSRKRRCYGKRWLRFNSNSVRLKATWLRTNRTRKDCFNSNSVRLKVQIPYRFHYLNIWFQFQFGTIKSPAIAKACQSRRCFNSNSVRLKGLPMRVSSLSSAVSIPIRYD